ncbi:type II toxin-antitoxin system PemK/MazF family toxin [Streptomyces sp. NPDC058534]|uniref:type II toxin-antitoxin system PemK/MazF family toxin n=1 Tax=Streptomyces sp. NPDC058534 TaxID=3346541 RepID=UPI00365B5BBE
MKRGHVYDIEHGGRSRRALVVSDDLVNERLGIATCVEVHEPGRMPPSILATELTAPLPGTAVVDTYATFAARYFDNDLGAVAPRDMEAVETGIRLVLML